MKEFRKIGVLTSGGDSPGMNAAIRAVTRSALAHGVEVVGILYGYSGLIKNKTTDLKVRDVSNIVNHGGTMLYSDRCLEFATPEGMAKAIATCKELGVDGIVTLGGDGTFRGATDMTNHGIPCVGIPCTIDNDIASTDYTIGFDTAMNTVVEMVDRLRDTCESHSRCHVIEVMGRDAGDIALQTSIAVGATAVAIPEMPFDREAMFAKIKNSRALGKKNFLIIVSEGMGKTYAEDLTAEIFDKTGVEARFTRLGHVVRGGRPTLRDRLLGNTMGTYAVERLIAGESNIVICERYNNTCSVDINYALILDRMYKGKLKDGDLDPYTPEQIAEMKEFCEEKRADVERLYNIVNTVGL